MRYNVGEFVLLNDGRTVYIYEVDGDGMGYQVNDMEDSSVLFSIIEDDILMKLI